MAVKIENATERPSLPHRFESTIQSVLSSVPREHLRGLERVRVVASISHQRLRNVDVANLPGLYHPKQGPQPAWIEISLQALLPSATPWHKRLLAKLSLKSNLATLLFSLVGQHHFLTLRHSYKKTQLEPSVRAYTQKHLRLWAERQNGWRTRLLKPLQPTLEKWAKSLQKKSLAAKKGRS
jgi:hypothetical protein